MSVPGPSLPKRDVRATSGLCLIATEERTSWDVSNVPSPEVSWFIDHFVGAFFLDKASRLYEQKASAVLVII
jgi:hypothetical protein